MNKKDFFNNFFITNSSKETQKLGRDFAKILKKRDVICLYGDLGSGKTTFVQGLAEGLGVKNRIISPTFIIVRAYNLRQGMFYHVDLYRVSSEDNIRGLGLEEITNDKLGIVAIEWAEKLESFLPDKRISIEFFYEKYNRRKIAFRL